MLVCRNIHTDVPPPLPGRLIFLFTVILLLWELLLPSQRRCLPGIGGLAYLLSSDVERAVPFFFSSCRTYMQVLDNWQVCITYS